MADRLLCTHMQIKPGLEEKYATYVANNSTDGYSRACVDCGETFGRALDTGSSPETAKVIMCATPDGQELTGFMMGAIMSAIVYFHPRGPEVKVWWNKECGGTGEEKGTINPAIITVATK